MHTAKYAGVIMAMHLAISFLLQAFAAFYGLFAQGSNGRNGRMLLRWLDYERHFPIFDPHEMSKSILWRLYSLPERIPADYVCV